MHHTALQSQLEALFENISKAGEIGAFMETAIREIYKSWILKPGNIAIDIGAHKGLHTIPMAACVTSKGKVFAFEACPDLSRHLRDALSDLPQVVVINKAVGAATLDSVTFFKNVEHPGQSTIVHGYGNNFTDENAFSVQCISLDDASNLFRNRLLRLIKIDAEGAELDILKGGTEMLKRHAPLVAAEISLHKFRGHSHEFFETLLAADYSAYTLSGLEVSQALLDSDFHSPCYTLMLAKNDHWMADFCSNPNKMQTLILRLAERWAQKSDRELL